MELLASLLRRKAAFVYPVLPAPATAVLDDWFRIPGQPGFRTRSQIRAFAHGWCAEAAAYRPAAVAGSWARLEPLLQSGVGSLTHAVVLLSRPRDGEILSAARRDRLWRAFRVPVFEQVIGDRGILLAAECQAHAGLHIESAQFDPGDRPVDTEVCGCRRATPRLKPFGQIEKIRATAAYAR